MQSGTHFVFFMLVILNCTNEGNALFQDIHDMISHYLQLLSFLSVACTYVREAKLCKVKLIDQPWLAFASLLIWK